MSTAPQKRTALTGVPPSPRAVPKVAVLPAAEAPIGGSGGTVTPEPLPGKAWRDAMKAATSALHRDQRNRRGKRPGPPIVGVRAARRQRGEQR